MKLLIVTQAVDSADPVLGFFHGWIEALAKDRERVTVICLKEGEHHLPSNVSVHSLGKERGRSPRSIYAFRFLSLAWNLRHEYDAVFVHMNQEYLLIAGWLWKLLGYRTYMWRNHRKGSLATDIAVAFCTEVFCTSAHSYTAKFAKTKLMPVGVDTDRFGMGIKTMRMPRSVLFLGRISPVKRPDVFIEALGILLGRSVSFIASMYGSPLPENASYYESLKAQAESLGLHDRIRFYPGISNDQTPAIYGAHEIYVNSTPSGAFDKTLFEAAASGCVVVAASEDFAVAAGPEAFFDGTAQDLAARLEAALSQSPSERAALVQKLEKTVEANSLSRLTHALSEAIY